MNDNPKTQPPNRLKETLARRIAKAGEDDVVVKQLRRQIASEERGLNSRQLFARHSNLIDYCSFFTTETTYNLSFYLPPFLQIPTHTPWVPPL